MPLEPTGGGPGDAFVRAGCHDPLRDRVLAFGWVGNRSRVWELAFAPAPAWRELPLRIVGAETDPASLSISALFFDPVTGDFWGWDWWAARAVRIVAGVDSVLAEPRLLASEPAEPWRFDALMFDPLRRRIVVFEEDFTGRDQLGGYWAVGVEGAPPWTWLETEAAPRRGRYDYAAAYDAGRDRFVIHGGYDDNDHYFDDWWALGFDRPTPALASLVGAEVVGRVARLAWHVASDDPASFTVERARQGGAWSAVAEVYPDGAGVVRFEDASLAPGERAGFRVLVADANGRHAHGEVWLEIPAGQPFALGGPVSNPVAGDLDVAFSLDRPGTVALDLLDLQGRRMASRSLSAGEGEQRVRLAGRGELEPGIYFIRIVLGERHATARVAVVR
jgi:hypothetical protein